MIPGGLVHRQERADQKSLFYMGNPAQPASWHLLALPGHVSPSPRIDKPAGGINRDFLFAVAARP